MRTVYALLGLCRIQLFKNKPVASKDETIKEVSIPDGWDKTGRVYVGLALASSPDKHAHGLCFGNSLDEVMGQKELVYQEAISNIGDEYKSAKLEFHQYLLSVKE